MDWNNVIIISALVLIALSVLRTARMLKEFEESFIILQEALKMTVIQVGELHDLVEQLEEKVNRLDGKGGD